MKEILDKHLEFFLINDMIGNPNSPKKVSLNLPKLKKVDKNKTNPIMELPKLKKVSDGAKV